MNDMRTSQSTLGGPGLSWLRLAALTGLAAAVVACGGGDGSRSTDRGEQGHDHDHIESSGRLAILDGQTNEVNFVDVDSGERVGVVGFGNTVSTLYTSPENRYVLAVQRDASQVNFIDSGLYTEDHGDHQHDYAITPSLSGFVLNGVKPTHYTVTDESGIIFNDGGDGVASSVDVFTEAAIRSTAPVVSIALENAMHGVAKRVNDQLFVSYRDPSITDTTLPAAIDRYSFDGETATYVERYEVACPRMHGAGANESYLAFGCSDGVMLIDLGSANYPASKLPNPEGLVGAERIGTIEAHHEVPALVGVAGNKVFVVQPQSDTPYQPLAVPGDSKRIDQGFSHDGRVFYVLKADGNLHLFDTRDGWRLAHTLAVVPAQTEGAAAPAIVASATEAHLFAISPASQAVTMVDATSGTIIKQIALPFTPTRLTWAGFDHHADAHSL